MSGKLAFENWKDSIGVVMPSKNDPMAIAMKNHGLDMKKQIDIALKSMYNDYLQEDNTMT